ncbi:hypothetical protein [Actinokineospora sp. HUAS TT18]|uniref:hypothetical protein n=1 Tax=Actinokineospora sp. HUAS TT18 TaxID=3447451 RepID=UPI003F5254C6
MRPQLVLSPGIRARALLTPGEGLLWAADTKLLEYRVRGLQRDGKPQRGLGARVGMGVATAAAEVVSVATADVDLPDGPRPDIAVFGPAPELIAVHCARLVTEPAVWCLTTHRLLVAVAVPEPEPEQAPSRGFFGELAKLGRDVATVVTTPTGDGHGRATLNPGLRPLTEIPRHQIGGLSIDGNALRVTLVDGSGFDFLSRGGRADLERAIALANGAPE